MNQHFSVLQGKPLMIDVTVRDASGLPVPVFSATLTIHDPPDVPEIPDDLRQCLEELDRRGLLGNPPPQSWRDQPSYLGSAR